MERLDEKVWKPVCISDIFEIKSGVRLEARNRTEGDRPFIGALDNSNGVVQFVSNENASLDSNVLGVNYNGNGMGIGFYHPYKCIFSDDVKRFHLKAVEDSENLALFMKTLIQEQRGKFGYLYKFNAKRMAATSILLPVTDSGEHDYEYMSEYMSQKREVLLEKYCTFVKSRIAELGEVVNIPELNEKEWRGFLIGNILTSTNSKPYHSSTLNFDRDSKLSYVTRTANNNGIYGFVTPDDTFVINPANTISFGAETAEFFYQSAPYITGNKMYYLKNVYLNEFIGLFLITAIRKGVKSCFSYANGAIPERVLKKRVMLPAKDTGEPDYDYMEQYSKNMILRKYQQYLSFLERREIP